MYISTHLPEFNNVTSNTEKLAAGVQKEEEKKNKVRDRILSPWSGLWLDEDEEREYEALLCRLDSLSFLSRS